MTSLLETRNLSHFDLGWACGYHDAEGHVRFSSHTLSMSISSTDRDTLERWMRIAGFGHITGPRQIGANKPIYKWYGSDHEKIQFLLAAFYPHLSASRRTQALNALRESLRSLLPEHPAHCVRKDCLSNRTRPPSSRGLCGPCYREVYSLGWLERYPKTFRREYGVR